MDGTQVDRSATHGTGSPRPRGFCADGVRLDRRQSPDSAKGCVDGVV